MAVLTDTREKITVKFPQNYKNWSIIMTSVEKFFEYRSGAIAFVTPAPVDDFTFTPEVTAELKQEVIQHVLLTLRTIDITQNGKNTENPQTA